MVKESFFEKYKQEIYFWIIVIGAVVLDQITKLIVYLNNPKIDLKLFEITFVKNTGAGFGILQGQTIWLVLISLAVVVTILLNYNKIAKMSYAQYLFALFLGGVIGNLIDRAFRGYVIDFINFRFWPAFNIADACISIAVIGLIIYFWKK
jgi:signal peptidase II